MPWSKTDYPAAVKNFKPSVRNKAVAIANHVLESTKNEGLAIATGIKKAKELALAKSFKGKK